MTAEEIKALSTEDEIAARAEEIREAMTAEGADLDALNAEVELLKTRKEEIKAERRAALEAVQAGAGEVLEQREEKRETMEKRNTPEYINAYAEYIKEPTAEKRALLSDMVEGGTVATPDFVYDVVKTAWENDDILSRVRKISLPGEVKINFEISASGAVVHTEGAAAVSEEELALGIVTLSPVYIKKWIGVSKQIYSLRGEEFLRYIYDELAHKIAKAAADLLVSEIAGLPGTATATTPAAAAIAQAPGLTTIAEAIANLSDEATKPVVIMNKLTFAAFKQAAAAANYAQDVFENLPVIFNNTLPAYGAATGVYAIVGDLENGALANFPNGEEIEFTFDPYTQKKANIIEILGERYTAIAPIASGHFVLIKHAE